MGWLRGFLFKDHSFSVFSLGVSFVGFAVRFCIMAFSLGLAQQIALPTDKTMADSNWIAISIISLAVVLLDYLKDYLKDRARRSLQRQDQILFSLVGASIERLIENRETGENNAKHRFQELLTQIESVIKLITKKSESQGVAISANIMVATRNGSSERLQLRHWGTKLAGRENITITIDSKDPAPGAGLAYIEGKPVYVHDTMADEFTGKFDPEKDYRTILSTPIFDSEDKVCAILNIDSTEANFFNTEEYIAKEVMPKIKPFIYLITLERDSL